MRVLQINAVYGYGSTGCMVRELHEYLKYNNIESYVACSQGCQNDSPEEFSIGNPLDVKIHSFMARLTGLQGYFSNNATKKLLQYIDRIEPDIVHLGNLHSNYINIIILLQYLGRKNIPTVITLHDCWSYTGKCSHYTVDMCYRWKKSCGSCPRLKKDIPSWFFDKTKKMITDKEICYREIKKLAIIGVSQWITNEAKQSILNRATIIEDIYNWVNLDIFYPRTAQAGQYRKKMGLEGKFVILGVSSIWSDIKGLATFFKLSKYLKDDEVIILVGQLDKRILPPNIIHISPTKSLDELATYYSMADIFLQMSPEESFGKVVAESMACGTPVITVNSTANSELVTASTGFVAEVGDIDGIVSNINKVKRDGSARYAEACRKYATLNFDIKKQLSKYVELYGSLLNI